MQEKIEETAYFASGCFWGVQYHFNKIEGVEATYVGYMGGQLENPSYEAVKTGTTGHVETLQVVYDPSRVSYAHLLRLYFETHDFTQVGGQGPDIGSQYRSVLFYAHEEQKREAEDVMRILTAKGYQVATVLEPKSDFWIAEDYHQHYYQKNGDTPYCHIYKKIF
ncbi:peptide-methionine (S)-S-oxide reductase [Parabacteroides sp. 52]|uniref:peptide-methionine (S)-S-oxide reductase MsrA n=1 Tax=unclassified Parabacteroides TaxID=2649774 RepID=UPI0013D0F5DF|nr:MULTISPECIES: peptide-methionine (S)-S-oxide reductase MsrA [unclassified Parabacteroides]MDH6533440.1 methionine-S-sulfoxide reductase [Parabacteroides sp. PM5-20]NDV54197.1 peptide-methionine (S)-S-oxide reductase [Parabacteroides sp. 52]